MSTIQQNTQQRFIITNDFIEAGMTPGGGWNRAQLAVIGIIWPPRRGWKNRCIGKEIDAEIARRFLELNPKRGNKTMVTDRFDQFTRRRESDPQDVIDDLLKQTTRQAKAIHELTEEIEKLKKQVELQEKTTLVDKMPEAPIGTVTGPEPDLETAELARQQAREGKGCTTQEFLDGLH